MEFSYFMPVRLLFGANVIDQLGATAKSYGTHALIVTGRSSTKRSGLLDRSIALLEAAGVRATVFNKVEPNPLTTTVMEGAALAREQGCDLVIGMGGGSMMDAAKAVAFCAVNGGDVNDYISGGKQGTGCLPILEVPTTCGTGSEANPFAVLTNPETKDKKSLWGDLIYPKVSFIDPAQGGAGLGGLRCPLPQHGGLPGHPKPAHYRPACPARHPPDSREPAQGVPR